MRLLTKGDVSACLAHIDPVAAVEDALRLHTTGQSVLPGEAYMPWTNSQGAYCRSLAMPGALGNGPNGVIGLKVINAAVSNPQSGIPRAGGFTTLFDFETGQPRLLADGALISALRTAAYTISSLNHLGPVEFDSVALIGCGNLGQVHAQLLRRYIPAVRHLQLFDVRSEAADSLAKMWTADGRGTATVCSSARQAAKDAEVLITLTTSVAPYIDLSWLDARAFVAHVSLADLRAEVFTGARAIYVDDVELVEQNPRRILGTLLRDGAVARSARPTGGPHVAGTLGEVLCGVVDAVRPTEGIVVSNPFGMSILDLEVLNRVDSIATKAGIGALVDLTSDTSAVDPAWIRRTTEVG
jgi:ornithine cyclodeaminase